MNEIIYYFTYYGTYLIKLLIFILILKFIFGKTIKNVHSHWNTLIDNFKFSTKDFYELLRIELQSHGIKGMNITYARLKEGNALSSKRLYLRLEWKGFQYDICAAPFGKGFFISWWMLYKNSFWQILFSKIPFIGGWLVKKLYPETYYKIDTASMFMTYAQSSVVKVIEDITKEKGIRKLTDDQKKPIMENVFKR